MHFALLKKEIQQKLFNKSIKNKKAPLSTVLIRLTVIQPVKSELEPTQNLFNQQ